MPSYKMISSDSHVVEPPDLWTQRVDPAFRHRAPRVVQEDDADYWYVDGIRSMSFHAGSQAGDRFDNPQDLKLMDRWENVRPGGYIPVEFIKDSEVDGVEASIIYPSEGLVLFDIPDGRLLDALFSRWQFHAVPGGLFGLLQRQLLVNKLSIETTVLEQDLVPLGNSLEMDRDFQGLGEVNVLGSWLDLQDLNT